MQFITEEMVIEYQKSDLYTRFLKNYEAAIRNYEDEEFFDSVRCHTFYVPTPWEVAAEYRGRAIAGNLDPAWIDKYMPEALTKRETYIK